MKIENKIEIHPMFLDKENCNNENNEVIDILKN